VIDEVLRNPEYRQNADRLRQVIADTNGLEKALDLLEEALGLHRPLVKESRALWVYYNRMACNRGYRECCSTMGLTSVGGRFKAAQINSGSELGEAAGN